MYRDVNLEKGGEEGVGASEERIGSVEATERVESKSMIRWVGRSAGIGAID